MAYFEDLIESSASELRPTHDQSEISANQDVSFIIFNVTGRL